MASARWLPASAFLPDGRLLITGGRVGNTALAFVEQYDQAANEWAGQGQSITFSLGSQNDSGITGTATLTNLGGGHLRVEIHVIGAARFATGPHPRGKLFPVEPGPKVPLVQRRRRRLDHRAQRHPSGSDLVAARHSHAQVARRDAHLRRLC